MQNIGLKISYIFSEPYRSQNNGSRVYLQKRIADTIKGISVVNKYALITIKLCNSVQCYLFIAVILWALHARESLCWFQDVMTCLIWLSHYIRITALLLSRSVDVIRPAAQPLLHCAISISCLSETAFLLFFFSLSSARSHLQAVPLTNVTVEDWDLLLSRVLEAMSSTSIEIYRAKQAGLFATLAEPTWALLLLSLQSRGQNSIKGFRAIFLILPSRHSKQPMY